MSLLSPALAVVGALVFALALAAPHPSVARQTAVAPQSFGDAAPIDPVALAAELAPRIVELPASPAEPPPPPPPPPPPAAVAGAQATPMGGVVVIASWYGPGFYGNTTACGQLYTPEIVGVAHRTLPCGTMLTLEFGGRVVTVPVIDRGPFIAGRTLDLSNATRAALACTDLCPVLMR